MFLSETSLTKISVNSLAHPLGYLYKIVYRINQYKKERNSGGDSSLLQKGAKR